MFYKILQDLNVPWRSLTTIMVVPGRVELDDHPYQIALDSNDFSILDTREEAMSHITENLALRLVATEGRSDTTFELGYQVRFGSTWHKIATSFLHTGIFSSISCGSSSRVCQHGCGRHAGAVVKTYTENYDNDDGENLGREVTSEEHQINDHISSSTSNSTGIVPRSEQLVIRLLDASPEMLSTAPAKAYKSTIDMTQWWILVRWWNKAGPGRIQHGYQIANQDYNCPDYSQLYAKASLAMKIAPHGLRNVNLTLYVAKCLECVIRSVEKNFMNKRIGYKPDADLQPYAYDKSLTSQETAKWGRITSIVAPACSIDVELSTDKPWAALNNAIAAEEGSEQASQSGQLRSNSSWTSWGGPDAASYDACDDDGDDEPDMNNSPQNHLHGSLENS